MIVVRAMFNTNSDGEWINDGNGWEWDHPDAPVCYYGPFDTMDDAVDWMENDYPDDDTDVWEMEAVELEVPDWWFINKPDSIFGDHPDEDIRTDPED